MLNQKFYLSAVVAALLLSTFAGCGSGADRDAHLNEIGQLIKAPVIKASVSRNIINTGENISFETTINNNTEIIKHEWTDENGKVLAKQANFNREFQKEGTYTTKLALTDDTGKVSTSTVIIKVNKNLEQNSENQAPIVTASASDLDIADGETVYFADDGSYDPDGSISKYEWRDMDGILLSDTKELNTKLYYHPQYDFNNNGTTKYIKTLTVTDNQGKTASKSFTIIVHKEQSPNPNQLPTIDAGANQTITQGESVTLRATSNTEIKRYEWKDESGILGTDAIITKDDFTVGVHNITLTTEDVNGIAMEDSLIITVNAQTTGGDQTLTAKAATDYISAPEGTDITFNANQSSNTNGDITTYEWKEGDTVLSTQESFSKSDLSIGKHTIVLTIADSDGKISTDSVEVTIKNINTENNRPTAYAGENRSVGVNNEVILTGTGIDSDGTIVSYKWTENGMIIGTDAVLKYTPLTVGAHTLQLTVTDSDEAQSAPVTVMVIATESVAGLDITPPVIALNGARVVNLTVGDSYLDAGAIASDNKDGIITGSITTLNQVNSTIAGTYTVTYNVKDAAGNSAVPTTRTVIVSQTSNQSITVNASSDKSVEVWKMTTLTGNAADSERRALTYKWSENGNTLATTKTLNYIPSTTGTHILVLTATNTLGVSASDTVVVTATESIVTADTTLPTIALIGSATVRLTVGDNYIDAGATANDNKDGEITNKITTTNQVNPAIEGTYIVAYNVKDTANNSAVPVIRTVIVSQAGAVTGDPYSDWVVAKNNLVRDVSKDFNGNLVTVLIEPGKQIGENDISNTIDAIYGLINNQQTGSLLMINQNYENGTKMVVRVYDANGNIKGTSNELSYMKDTNIEFSPINF